MTPLAAQPATQPTPVTPPSSPDLPESDFAPLEGMEDLAWPTVESTTDDSPAPDTAATRYQLSVDGLKALGLLDEFEGLSTLWLHRAEDSNLAQINRRIAEDRDLLDQLMRSIGYYGGMTSVTITPPRTPGGITRITLKVTPGPIYTYDEIIVTAPPKAVAAVDPAPVVTPLLGISVGDPIEAAQVTAAQDALPVRLADAGYAFARIVPPEIGIDHATRTANLLQYVDLGRRGVFGRLTISGDTQGFDSEHLQLLARFKPGEAYRNGAREDLRRALIQTGLFGSVSIKPTEGAVLEDGRSAVDLEIVAEGAPVRTIAAAGGYSTGQGIRLEGSWTHRNLFPPEGALTLRAVGAQREQVAQVEFRRRNFKRRDQSLTLTGGLSFSQQFAFSANTLGATAAIMRESNTIWQKPLTYSIAAQVLATSQRDLSAPGQPRNQFFVVAFPGSVTWDQSDDLLNPSRGFRLTGRLSPEFTLRSGTSVNYVKAQIDGSIYQPVGSLVLAGRVHFGAILGANRGVIVPDRRFYAGGGGSVRGYEFQRVGPRSPDGNPTGGNSLVEASIEARYRFRAFGADLGVVGFVDAGQVYQSTVPSLRGLKAGAGVGLRYYTGFGPIRIDVATPINPEPGDPRIAFYVSIGQAF